MGCLTKGPQGPRSTGEGSVLLPATQVTLETARVRWMPSSAWVTFHNFTKVKLIGGSLWGAKGLRTLQVTPGLLSGDSAISFIDSILRFQVLALSLPLPCGESPSLPSGSVSPEKKCFAFCGGQGGLCRVEYRLLANPLVFSSPSSPTQHFREPGASNP